jgi:hypothetical protein
LKSGEQAVVVVPTAVANVIMAALQVAVAAIQL